MNNPVVVERYVSPFEEGMNAARNGVSWTRCPYTASNQQYDRTEWLRGHQAYLESKEKGYA